MRTLTVAAALLAAVISLTLRDAPLPAQDKTEGVLAWPKGLPVYDHIVIVIEENKGYDLILGNPRAPYINNVLCKEGANFTRMFAEEHPSEGNYFWLFSGSNQSVGFKDVIPSAKTHSNYPFMTPNLARSLIDRGLSFKGYAEDLPAIGSKVNSAKLYARRHVPWISFGNIPNGDTVSTSCNLRFLDFPADYKKLPTVAMVVPNLINVMHNGKGDKAIAAGDAWLKSKIDPYYQWAKNNNSLLIVTFDECDFSGSPGLTDPAIQPVTKAARIKQNRIPTIFAGAHIKPGDYEEGKGINHVSILRTIEAMYGLPRAGAQQALAVRAGISDSYIITDVFDTIKRGKTGPNRQDGVAVRNPRLQPLSGAAAVTGRPLQGE